MSALTNRTLPLLFFILILLGGCSRQQPIASSTSPQSISGKVVKIIDGDTVVVLDSQNAQHRIRLKGVDAPERNQSFYQVSRDNLANLIFQKDIRVEYQTIDRDERPIGTIWVDGKDACLEQVEAGMAWHFKRYSNEQSPAEREQYAKAEQNARVRKGGLWQEEDPTPPWEFRKTRNGSGDETASAELSQPQSLHHSPSTPANDKSSNVPNEPAVGSNSREVSSDGSGSQTVEGGNSWKQEKHDVLLARLPRLPQNLITQSSVV